MGFLSGKKTYIGAFLMFLVTMAVQAGVLTQAQGDTIFALLVAFGFAAMRAAVGKVNK